MYVYMYIYIHIYILQELTCARANRGMDTWIVGEGRVGVRRRGGEGMDRQEREGASVGKV